VETFRAIYLQAYDDADLLPPISNPVRIRGDLYRDSIVTRDVLERLDALAFEPTRSHRKALYRFNRLIIDGEDAAGEAEETVLGGTSIRKEDKNPHPSVVLSLPPSPSLVPASDLTGLLLPFSEERRWAP